jgi:hypothetical protein
MASPRRTLMTPKSLTPALEDQKELVIVWLYFEDCLNPKVFRVSSTEKEQTDANLFLVSESEPGGFAIFCQDKRW